MAEALEQTDLSDGCRGHAIILLLEPDFLKGYDLASDCVEALVDDTISTLTKLLLPLVPAQS